jgi:hypothetical protein
MKNGATEAQGHSVARRRVFYVPGYDPFPARRYREIYRTEGPLQAAISGYELTMQPTRREDAQPNSQDRTAQRGFGWSVRARMDGIETHADIEVLVWSDIVRGSMGAGVGATYLQMARTLWLYLASGALFRLMRLRKGPLIAAMYPVVVLLVQAALALGLAWGVARAFGMLWPGGWPMGAALGLIAGYALLRGFRALDPRILAYYLQHDYAFTAQLGGAIPPALETRMADFGARIRAALAQDYDEVLVIGHSSGAHLAVSVLADLLRTGLPAGAPPLAFLSLGQVVPMVSFLPNAHRLRADLHDLSASDVIAWVDVSAPGDGCSFALCDPVAVSGVSPPVQYWPLVISAAFSQSLRPETWARLRWRFFRLHFQYLHAFDAPRDYDYFAITAGPQTLRARFAGRAPSRSCITTPLSPHRGMAA